MAGEWRSIEDTSLPQRFCDDLKMIFKEFPLITSPVRCRLCDEKDIYAIEVEYADGRIRRFNDFRYGVYPVDATQAEFETLYRIIGDMQVRTCSDIGRTHLEAFREMAAAQLLLSNLKDVENIDTKLVESVDRLVETLEKSAAVHEKYVVMPVNAVVKRLKKRVDGIGARCKKVKYDGDVVAYKDIQMEYVNALELYIAELKKLSQQS